MSIRVLHATSAFHSRGGGTSMALAGLAPAQAEAGVDVRVLTTAQPDDETQLADQLRARGICVRLVIGRGKLYRSPELPGEVERAVAAADVVHIHGTWEEIQHLAARAAFRLRKPYVIRPAGMLDPWSYKTRSRWRKELFMLWRVRRNLNRAAAIHYTTPMERDVSARHHLKPPTIVEPNGVALEEFKTSPDVACFRRRFPALGDSPYIVFLGRQNTGKGLELLIPAFAQAVKDDPRTVLLIVGPDWNGLQQEWSSLAARHGVGRRVIFTGMLHGPDRVAALAGARLFALPSFHENFGIAVVEALAAGVPVIVSDQVYVHPEITAAGVGGVVPLRVDSLAGELRKWLDDDVLRDQAARRARPFAWEHYDWQQIAARWRKHYQQLLATGDRAEGTAGER